MTGNHPAAVTDDLRGSSPSVDGVLAGPAHAPLPAVGWRDQRFSERLSFEIRPEVDAQEPFVARGFGHVAKQERFWSEHGTIHRDGVRRCKHAIAPSQRDEIFVESAMCGVTVVLVPVENRTTER